MMRNKIERPRRHKQTIILHRLHILPIPLLQQTSKIRLSKPLVHLRHIDYHIRLLRTDPIKTRRKPFTRSIYIQTLDTKQPQRISNVAVGSKAYRTTKIDLQVYSDGFLDRFQTGKDIHKTSRELGCTVRLIYNQPQLHHHIDYTIDADRQLLPKPNRKLSLVTSRCENYLRPQLVQHLPINSIVTTHLPLRPDRFWFRTERRDPYQRVLHTEKGKSLRHSRTKANNPLDPVRKIYLPS